MRGPAGLGIKLTHSAPRRRAEARSRGCSRRSGASSWWRSPGTATRPATTSPAWTRSTSCWTTGAQGLPPASALPYRADSPPAVGGRPGRSAGRRAAAGGARLDGACHRAAHNPHRTRTLISLVARCRKGLLVGVTARTWAPASGVELCPVLAGQQWTRPTGCWVRMPGTGIAGHGGRDGRREPRREQCVSPAEPLQNPIARLITPPSAFRR
jgi:hypothetical protein